MTMSFFFKKKKCSWDKNFNRAFTLEKKNANPQKHPHLLSLQSSKLCNIGRNYWKDCEKPPAPGGLG